MGSGYNGNPQPDLGPTEVASAAALACAYQEISDVDGSPFVILPPGYTRADLSDLLCAPTRIKAHVELHTVQSLIDYVVKHKGADSRVYFIRQNGGGRFVCVIDDNGDVDDKAGWRAHTANHTLVFSRRYLRWSGNHNKWLGQDGFVEFIEANLPDIAEPNGAELLELCRNLEITKSASFSSMTRTAHDSVSFAYSEETKAGKGVVTVPTKLTLVIPVFDRGPFTTIDAKFKFRLSEGKLHLGYELLRLDDIVDAEIDRSSELVREKTGLQLLYGNPNV